MSNITFIDAVAGVPHVRAASSRPRLVRRLFDRIHRAVLASTMRRELERVPDHLLKDIGVSRSEIDAIVAGSVDGTIVMTRQVRGRR